MISKSEGLFGVLILGVVSLAASGAVAQSLAVFPLDGVNIPAEKARAASLLLETEFENAGFSVVDSSKFRSTEGTAGSDSHSGKALFAKARGCDYFVTGSLIGLGDQTQLHVALYTVEGSIVAEKKMSALTDTQLPSVIARLATALAPPVHSSSPETVQSAPVPAAVPTPEPNSPPPAKSEAAIGPETNLGIALGQAFGIGDEMRTFTAINFDGRLEFDYFIVGLNAGIALGTDEIPKGFHFNVDISGAAYLTNTAVAPYLGAGVGLFVGRRLAVGIDDEDDSYYDEDEDPGDFVIGWSAFPLVGLEFLRHRRMRLHVDFRYLFGFTTDTWGHGPMAMVGVNF